MVTPRKAARADLIKALEEMPDEAFGYLALASLPKAMTHGATAQIWPDGTGGFMDTSRDAIAKARDAAGRYVSAPEQE